MSTHEHTTTDTLPDDEAAPGADAAPEAEDARSEPADVVADASEDAGSEPGRLRELEDRYLRAKAELDNFRKRTQREYAEVRNATKAAVVEEFLNVFDHFQMAMAHADQSHDMDVLKQGMTMILGEFNRAFENLGVATLDAAGKAFDPLEHQAVAQEASTDVPEGCVIRQWKCGYRLGDRLLRPATVVVSSGPPDGDADAADAPASPQD